MVSLGYNSFTKDTSFNFSGPNGFLISNLNSSSFYVQLKFSRIVQYTGQTFSIYGIDSTGDTVDAFVEELVYGHVNREDPSQSCCNWWDQRDTDKTDFNTCESLMGAGFNKYYSNRIEKQYSGPNVFGPIVSSYLSYSADISFSNPISILVIEKPNTNHIAGSLLWKD